MTFPFMLRTQAAPRRHHRRSSQGVRSWSALAVAALAISWAGCAHAPPKTVSTVKSPPPPAPRVQSDDDFARVHADYEVMDPASPARPGARASLESWLLEEARHDRAADRADESWDALQRAFGLWDPDELRGGPRDPALASAVLDEEQLYRKRGAHREVVTLLGVRLTLVPDDREARSRFDQVAGWLRGGDHDHCGEGCERLIDDLESAVAAWPSPFLVDQLAQLYSQRQQAASSFNGERSGSLAELIRRRGVQRTGVDLARLYLRVSQPEQARAALARIAGQPGDDPALRDLIDHAYSATPRAVDVVALAVWLARDPANKVVAARICRDAALRFPSAPEPELCLGKFAVQLDQITVAIRAFSRAVALAPDKRDAWEALATLYQARLAQFVGDERTEQLEAELKKVEAFHDEARRRFPGDPLRTSLAGALYEVGRGYFNAGRIDDAVRYLGRSIEITPTVFAEEQLAAIELRRERAPEAVTLYRGAIELDRQQRSRGGRDGSAHDQPYWSAKLHRGLGDALDAIGSSREARDARRRSLDGWDRVLAQHLEPEESAEAELERGKLLFALGEHERAIAAFEAAVDAQPERSSTYADALSFLVPRGVEGEAADAYHRALGRANVSEYIKVYASIWILDLERRLHQPEDPLARQFLEGVHGAHWHDDLARWATGHESDAELTTHADTPGKRCELDFYLSMRALGDGRADDARALWKKVIASQMMAFFEYDMASYYLRHEGQ